jgi:transposase
MSPKPLADDGIVASFVLNGAMNGASFLAYLVQILAPILKRDDVVIIDNLTVHHVAGVRDAIEAAGAALRYLPSVNITLAKACAAQQSPGRAPLCQPLGQC